MVLVTNSSGVKAVCQCIKYLQGTTQNGKDPLPTTADLLAATLISHDRSLIAVKEKVMW